MMVFTAVFRLVVQKSRRESAHARTFGGDLKIYSRRDFWTKTAVDERGLRNYLYAHTYTTRGLVQWETPLLTFHLKQNPLMIATFLVKDIIL